MSVMEGVRGSGGPLLVEIERAAGTSLGITLTHAHPTDPSGAIVIETIRTASIAERFVALNYSKSFTVIDNHTFTLIVANVCSDMPSLTLEPNFSDNNIKLALRGKYCCTQAYTELVIMNSTVTYSFQSRVLVQYTRDIYSYRLRYNS